jgi:hypothetical protein
MDLAFDPNSIPSWTGQIGAGTFVNPPAAMIVDPGGHHVGWGGSPAIYSGATLCLEYYPSTSEALYLVTFDYHGASASVTIGFG